MVNPKMYLIITFPSSIFLPNICTLLALYHNVNNVQYMCILYVSMVIYKRPVFTSVTEGELL